jgi:DNA-binding NtrC family response regulator
LILGAASPSLALVPAVSPTPPKAIVLVDDERSYTELMTQMLADNLDCPVHGFTRAHEALKSLAQLNPGVIVTDYFMPQLDGIEFIRQASVIVPNAVFVMITGHNLSADQDKLDRLTALKGFLSKPFGWRKLADEIIRVWPDQANAPIHKADATSL